MMAHRSFSATHAGARRTRNEDNYVDRPDLGLWAVADGAGGHEAGEVASAMIRDALEAVPPNLGAGQLLAEARGRLLDVHAALLDEAVQRGPDVMMASTVAILLVRDSFFAALWAGDSRVYLLRGGILSQLRWSPEIGQVHKRNCPAPPGVIGSRQQATRDRCSYWGGAESI